MTAAPHTVVVVAFDGLQLLDLAGPVEVLRTATRLGASPPYRTMVATPDGQPVRSESGVSVAADVSLAALARLRGTTQLNHTSEVICYHQRRNRAAKTSRQRRPPAQE